MNKDEFNVAINYWNKKDIKAMPKDELKKEVVDFISNEKVCALATGFNDYVRCTPLEYVYFEDKFYIFTEGGEKFVGLENNENVSLAIYDKEVNFQKLRSVQISGKANIVDTLSDEYFKVAEYKMIPKGVLEKLALDNHPMYLICISPKKMNILFSSFKEKGYDSRQILEF